MLSAQFSSPSNTNFPKTMNSPQIVLEALKDESSKSTKSKKIIIVGGGLVSCFIVYQVLTCFENEHRVRKVIQKEKND